MSDEQSNYPDQEPLPGQPASPAPSRRIMLSMIVAVVVMVGAIIPFFLSQGGDDGSLRSSEPAQTALEAARNNTQVASALGSRIRMGDPIVGSVTERGSTADADLTIPLIGSEGEGTLYVIGTRANGAWTYSTLAVQLPDQANLIRLEQP